MEIVAVEDGSGVGNCMLARGTSAAAAPLVELMRPRQDAVAETGDKTAEQQCEHFSIRGYVALLQKKDPKFCSLSRILHEQKQCDGHQACSSPLSVANFRRWDCSKCLDKLKISDHRTTPMTFSAKQDVTSDGCSITFIRSTFMPANVGSKRLSSCTPQSSQGKDVDTSIISKSAQEGNSKCIPPSDKKGATETNIDLPTKDLQGSTYNYDMTANIFDNASMDVVDLPIVPHITSSKEANDTDQPPHSSKVSEVVLKLNEDADGKTEEILVADHNLTKDLSGQKCDQVLNGDQCEEDASTRSVKSDCKKANKKKMIMKKKHTNKHTAQFDVSHVKISRRKPQKVRLLSEIINTSQAGDSRSDEVRENVADRCEGDRHMIPLDLSMDIPVNHQTVRENGLKSTKDKTKRKGADAVDDGSSLMNWLNGKKKKITENVHHDPVGGLSNPVISTQQDDENNLQNGLERDMQKTDGICQDEPENSTQRCSSKAKTSSLSKRKIHSAANAKYGDENTGNKSQKIPILRPDDQCQMEPESSVQRCLTKVPPAKRDVQNIQNMAGLHDQSLPKKRKKQTLEVMNEKQPMIDDIPMDIVELLAKNQHERQLMTETDSSDINHTQSKTTADDDCVIVAAMDGPNYATSVLDTNFQQKSSTSESTQKELQGHLALSTQDTSLHPLNLQISDHSKSTQEQQTHLWMEEMVTIAASSPLFSHHYDQYIAEAPTECSGHKEAKKLTWNSFKAAPRNLWTAACGAQFRPSIQAVDLTSTHVMGSSNNYPTHQPVIAPLDHCTERAINQVQARSFPSTISTMEAGNLCDRRNAGKSILYPKEPMPATHLLRIMDPSTLTGFPNYEMSSRSQMEFQLHNSQYARSQYKGSTSTSYGSNLNGKVPLTLEDLSRRQFQHNLHRPFRPHPRVGVLGSLLQKEIANWSENSGTQSGYRLGVSEGITSHQINRKEHFEALNSGMFSAKWNALQLGSVSPSAELLSARNSISQSWTRGKGKMTHPLDKFVRQDICITNRNPADFTTVGDNNEYMTYR